LAVHVARSAARSLASRSLSISVMPRSSPRPPPADKLWSHAGMATFAETGAPEVPLAGGDVTAGVVRVGATVRRPVQPQTPAVHAFLRHLEAAGFEGAPRVLGIDGQGREVLSFVPGDVPPRPLPPWAATDGALAGLARLQR